jgi:PmbA protein
VDASLVKLAEDAVEHALRRGARQAAVGLHRARFIELKQRDGKIETLQSSTTRGLSIALYVDGRYSSNATSFLAEREVMGFIDEALAMTRKLAPDPHRALPEPELYGPATGHELDLEDPGYDRRDMAWREQLVAAAEEAARAPGERVISASAELTTQASESLQLHSNGFRGQRRATSYHLTASVTARDEEGRRPEDYAHVAARHAGDLPAAEEVGREAAARALARVGARKTESRRMALVVENRAAARLLAALLEPLSGAALQQRRSCFAGRRGLEIGSHRLTLREDPFLPRGLGSRLYDEEGLRAAPRPIVTRGRLDDFLVDVYYGRKLGVPATGGSSSNLVLEPGSRSLDELVADVGRGALVTSFLGGNSNPATGDFSFGVSGYLIERGARARPVSEMNITGSQLELWHRLEVVGADPYRWSAWRIPSLLFADVQFSGL